MASRRRSSLSAFTPPSSSSAEPLPYLGSPRAYRFSPDNRWDNMPAPERFVPAENYIFADSPPWNFSPVGTPEAPSPRETTLRWGADWGEREFVRDEPPDAVGRALSERLELARTPTADESAVLAAAALNPVMAQVLEEPRLAPAIGNLLRFRVESAIARSAQSHPGAPAPTQENVLCAIRDEVARLIEATRLRLEPEAVAEREARQGEYAALCDARGLFKKTALFEKVGPHASAFYGLRPGATAVRGATGSYQAGGIGFDYDLRFLRLLQLLRKAVAELLPRPPTAAAAQSARFRWRRP